MRVGETTLAEPHVWAMQMAQQQIDWLCKDWQPERRDECPEHEKVTRGCGLKLRGWRQLYAKLLESHPEHFLKPFGSKTQT